ncbi:TatD DNase family protein [Marchantia polymorpha subsp. ruderalis]|uniref:TatD related DNase n=2 Tax=Marchantia polymorpha TaxID=3197 RepID=A0AAF6B158_MARPO|nr:hypothetical protein MARPO_0004s0110 [Marchantia polymorpha]BBN05742.1 hypothetical protein Mp_3g15620 [Marchantia polymorpha subsp. ruderalis]|eukprot:PTQ48837.1 hypothetical protein MARPO_0004s0110 [Marchantia polymorpha]
MSRLALFDAHCHLQDLRVAHCAPLLIKQASEVGVRWFAVNGTSEDDWRSVKEMGESQSTVIPNFGLHPWFIPGRTNNWLETLKGMLESTPTAAVGEIGLDLGTHGSKIDEALQLDILKAQLTLARNLNRPASLHCVRAIGPLQHLLEEMGTFPAGFIMHSFTGPADAVRGLVKHGAYFSFSGFLTPLRASKARAILQQVPRDRILLETDAPDAVPKVDPKSLLWVPDDSATPTSGEVRQADADIRSCCSDKNDGKTAKKDEACPLPALNHPANIRTVLKHVSTLMGVSEEELSAVATENATRIFSFQGSKLSL